MPDFKTQYLIEVAKRGTGGTEAARELRAVAEAGTQAQTVLRGLGQAFSFITAGASLAAFLTQSIRAFSQQEQAVAKLNGSLRASGQFTQAYSRELQALAGDLQDVTTFGDDAIVGVQAQLIAFGAAREQLPRLTELVLDLATGMGTDAASAAMTMGKAISGEFTALNRLGLEFDKDASAAKNLEAAMTQLESRFGGLARGQAETLTGSLQGTRNALNDLQEQVGEFILRSIDPMVRSLREGYKALNDVLTANPQGRKEIEAANDRARAALETEIKLLLEKKRITEEIARRELTRLKVAFTPDSKTENKFTDTLNPDGPSFRTVTTTSRNLSVETSALGAVEAALAAANPKAKTVSAEAQAALRDLQKIEAQIALERKTGIERERAEAEKSFSERERQIETLAARAGAKDDEVLQHRVRNQMLLTEQLEAIDEKHRAKESEELERAVQHDLETERRAAEQAAKLQEQRDEARLRALQSERELRRDLDLALANASGALAAESLPVGAGRESALRGAGFDAQLRDAQARADAGRERVGLLDLEEESAQELLQINQQLLEIETARIERARELGQATQEITATQRIVSGGFNDFTLGISRAFAESDLSMKKFGVNARQMLADLLRDMAAAFLRLALIRALLGAFGPGKASDFISSATGIKAAHGGVFPRALAAGGIAGLSMLTAPTYFPRFNVLAGEAGREAMAVLARPRLQEFGGVTAMVGQAEGHAMALTSASNLTRVNQSGGEIVVYLEMSPEVEGRITRNSIAGARVELTRGVRRDSAFRSAVRESVL